MPLPVTLHAWRQRPRFWALVLVLAVLWLTLWGQWHRAWHPVALGQQAQAEVLAASHLGHDEGSGLCHLLDHLSDGAGLPTLHWLSMGAATPTPAWAMAAGVVVWAQLRLCDARAPPAF